MTDESDIEAVWREWITPKAALDGFEAYGEPWETGAKMIATRLGIGALNSIAQFRVDDKRRRFEFEYLPDTVWRDWHPESDGHFWATGDRTLWVRYGADNLYRGELVGVRFDPTQIAALLPEQQASPSGAQVRQMHTASEKLPFGSLVTKSDHSGMHAEVRSHIRLALATLHEQVLRGLKEHLESLYSQFGAGNRLHSEAMLRAAIRKIEDHGRQFVTSAVDRISGVDRSLAAFTMIEDGFAGFVSVLEAEAEAVADTATGEQGSAAHKSNIAKLSTEGFREVRRRLESQLALHRLPFIMTLGNPPVVQNSSLAEQQPSATTKNKGGRPLADHWDEMWADIAVRLWTGWDPKTQADVEREMHEWLAAHDLDAGDTTVRARARKLWDKMQASE